MRLAGRKRVRMRTVALVLAVAQLVSLGAAIFSYWQAELAREAQAEAEAPAPNQSTRAPSGRRHRACVSAKGTTPLIPEPSPISPVRYGLSLKLHFRAVCRLPVSGIDFGILSLRNWAIRPGY